MNGGADPTNQGALLLHRSANIWTAVIGLRVHSFLWNFQHIRDSIESTALMHAVSALWNPTPPPPWRVLGWHIRDVRAGRERGVNKEYLSDKSIKQCVKGQEYQEFFQTSFMWDTLSSLSGEGSGGRVKHVDFAWKIYGRRQAAGCSCLPSTGMVNRLCWRLRDLSLSLYVLHATYRPPFSLHFCCPQPLAYVIFRT